MGAVCSVFIDIMLPRREGVFPETSLKIALSSLLNLHVNNQVIFFASLISIFPENIYSLACL